MSADMTGDPLTDPAAAALAAATELAERTGCARHDVAIVLGSGWVPAVEALGTPNVATTFTAAGLRLRASRAENEWRSGAFAWR